MPINCGGEVFPRFTWSDVVTWPCMSHLVAMTLDTSEPPHWNIKTCWQQLGFFFFFSLGCFITMFLFPSIVIVPSRGCGNTDCVFCEPGLLNWDSCSLDRERRRGSKTWSRSRAEAVGGLGRTWRSPCSPRRSWRWSGSLWPCRRTRHRSSARSCQTHPGPEWRCSRRWTPSLHRDKTGDRRDEVVVTEHCPQSFKLPSAVSVETHCQPTKFDKSKVHPWL